MNKKWMPFAVAAAVLAVGFLLWRVLGNASGADDGPSIKTIVDEIPKAPADTKPMDGQVHLPPGIPAPGAPGKAGK